MKQIPKEPGLISLDRLEVLKERFLLSVKEYRNLLESLKKSFKGDNTDQITYLQNLEKVKLKIIHNRFKIFNAHATYLEKKGFPIIKIKTEVYNSLDDLKKWIKKCKDDLVQDKEDLKTEVSKVGYRLKKIGKAREFTAQRIDIKT